jgi:hypothetical protein
MGLLEKLFGPPQKPPQPSTIAVIEERMSLIRYLISPGVGPGLFDADKLTKYLSISEQLRTGPLGPGEKAKILKAAQATPPIHMNSRLMPSYEFLRWRFADDHLKEVKKLIDKAKLAARYLPPIRGQPEVLAKIERSCHELERWANEEKILAFQRYPSS